MFFDGIIPAPLLPIIKGRLKLQEKTIAADTIEVEIESLRADALKAGAEVGALTMELQGKPVTAFFVIGVKA